MLQRSSFCCFIQTETWVNAVSKKLSFRFAVLYWKLNFELEGRTLKLERESLEGFFCFFPSLSIWNTWRQLEVYWNIVQSSGQKRAQLDQWTHFTSVHLHMYISATSPTHLSSPSFGLCLAPCGSPGSAAECLPATAWFLHSGCWLAGGTCPGKVASRRTVCGPGSLYLREEAWCLERRENAVIWGRKAAVLITQADSHSHVESYYQSEGAKMLLIIEDRPTLSHLHPT